MLLCRGFVVSIHALKEMAVDDLIWTHNGVYHLCRVPSTWKYSCDAAHIYEDVINYVMDVEFHEIGTVEMVPEGVVNSFRASAALQRIKGDVPLKYSEYLYVIRLPEHNSILTAL